MSRAELEAVLAELETWLAEGALPPAEHLADWNARFRALAAGAERGPGWDALVQRAHTLAARLDRQVAALQQQKEVLQQELAGHSVGQRALKAYRQVR